MLRYTCINFNFGCIYTLLSVNDIDHFKNNYKNKNFFIDDVFV